MEVQESGHQNDLQIKGTLRETDKGAPSRVEGVIYQVPCAECERVYIGETGRRL